MTTDPTVLVRPATPGDKDLLLAWRDDPTTRAVSLATRPIDPADHARWFAGVLVDPDRRLRIAVRESVEVAAVRFDRQPQGSDVWRVSIVVAPDHRGAGVGLAALGAAVADLRADHPTARVLAEVVEGNDASSRMFARAGFVRGRDRGAPATAGDPQVAATHRRLQTWWSDAQPTSTSSSRSAP